MGKSVIDEQQIDLAVLDSDTGHGPGWLSLIKQEYKRGLLFNFNSEGFLCHQRLKGLNGLALGIAEFDTKEGNGVAGNGLRLRDVMLAEFIGLSESRGAYGEKADTYDECEVKRNPLHDLITLYRGSKWSNSVVVKSQIEATS